MDWLMNRMKFLREGVKNLKTVGTITRSSRFLCREMIEEVNFAEAKMLVELGAGDGVLTKHILAEMRPDAKLLTFEVQSSFCEVLRKIDDDRLVVVEDSAENLGQYLNEHGAEAADYILSAIPFVLLPKELGRKIVTTCRDHLGTSGSFKQIHYSLVLKPLYEDIFDQVDVNFVPINLPPAFVLSCSQQGS